MPLQFGLNVKKTTPPRRSIWDDPEDDDEDEQQSAQASEDAPATKFGLSVRARDTTTAAAAAPPPPQQQPPPVGLSNPGGNAPRQASRKLKKVAEEIDPSIYDYDTFLEAKSTLTEAKKEAARQDAVERKPKYINKLLDAASRRKQDQLVAQEKLLQRERETEGDEFADKEKFVTGAYKQQQAEARKLEQEEQARAEADEERRRRMGGGMQGFYRTVMDQAEKTHQEAMEVAASYEKGGNANLQDQPKAKSDAELAAEMRARGVNVQLNEEGRFVDKRELLTAGLNVVPSGTKGKNAGADHLRASTQRQQSTFNKRDYASDRAQGERQRKMIDEQLEASVKRKRQEDEETRLREERDAKSKKTTQDVSDAKARYLARKAAKERGEG